MTEKIQFVQPKYQQIALELAKRISDGRYPEGEKLHARSTIATNFHVSPETARKAIIVLGEIGVVTVKHGSGFFVASAIKAKEFVEQYQDVESIESVKREIHESAKRQQAESQHFLHLLNSLVEQTQRYNEDNKLQPYEAQASANFQSSTVSDLNFWHNTGATIVAIKHENKMTVSPGPLAVIEPNDFVYVVGDELAYQRVGNLLRV